MSVFGEMVELAVALTLEGDSEAGRKRLTDQFIQVKDRRVSLQANADSCLYIERLDTDPQGFYSSQGREILGFAAELVWAPRVFVDDSSEPRQLSNHPAIIIVDDLKDTLVRYLIELVRLNPERCEILDGPDFLGSSRLT